MWRWIHLKARARHYFELYLPIYKTLFVSWGVVMGIWLLNWFFMLLVYGGDGKRGTFGDMFGGINALFTGLAFATLIYTAWMQQGELKLQREALGLQRDELMLQRIELGHTREEIKGQKEQLQQQSATFELQRFESTIFSLLNVHRDNLNNIEFSNLVGAAAFKVFYNRFKSLYDEAPVRHQRVSMDIPNRINLTYRDFFNSYQHLLGTYFQHLFLVFNFINQSEMSNKKLYSDIVRAQLSSYELVILFYHSISMHGHRLKPLAESFTLFENLPVSYLIDHSHKQQLESQAFLAS